MVEGRVCWLMAIVGRVMNLARVVEFSPNCFFYVLLWLCWLARPCVSVDGYCWYVYDFSPKCLI